MSSGVAVSHHLLLFLLLFMLSVSRGASVVHVPEAGPGPAASDDGPWVMKPAAMGLAALMLNETRRRLGGFQICALCTCCGGPRGLCLPSPCCYAINCNIPNRPFGFCSFTPRSCNCFGCHL